MGRLSRTKSATGIYHVMVRGVNKCNIFLDQKDMQRMYEKIAKYKEEMGVKIFAWCFMPNHVHLLIATEKLDIFMKKICCSHAMYFNKKYSRCGHLFQNRFKSISVQDEKYLMTLVRYIHQNPQKAGISAMESYAWSSYGEYLSKSGLVNYEIRDDLFHSRKMYIEFMSETNDYTDAIETVDKLPEDDARRIVAQYSILNKINEYHSLSKEKRQKSINYFSNEGLTASQIMKYTNMSKHIVYRYINAEKK